VVVCVHGEEGGVVVCGKGSGSCCGRRCPIGCARVMCTSQNTQVATTWTYHGVGVVPFVYRSAHVVIPIARMLGNVGPLEQRPFGRLFDAETAHGIRWRCIEHAL
jgi:hypothetical protein